MNKQILGLEGHSKPNALLPLDLFLFCFVFLCVCFLFFCFFGQKDWRVGEGGVGVCV